MRYFTLSLLALSVTACAPSYHQSNFSGGHAHKSVNSGHMAQNLFMEHNPSYSTYKDVHSAYSDASYSGAEPVTIYPVGCANVDVSGCAHEAEYSDHAVRPPNLRRGNGRKNFYGSIGAGTFDIDRDIYTGVMRLGVDGGYLGLEVEGSKSFKSDKTTLTSGTLQKDEIDYSVAGFGVVRVPLGSRIKALGRFGYHFTKMDQSLTATSGTTTVSAQKINDIAYGGGLEFDVSVKDSFRIDYTGYETDTIGRADSVTASYLRRF